MNRMVQNQENSIRNKETDGLMTKKAAHGAASAK